MLPCVESGGCGAWERQSINILFLCAWAFDFDSDFFLSIGWLFEFADYFTSRGLSGMVTAHYT